MAEAIGGAVSGMLGASQELAGQAAVLGERSGRFLAAVRR